MQSDRTNVRPLRGKKMTKKIVCHARTTLARYLLCIIPLAVNNPKVIEKGKLMRDDEEDSIDNRNGFPLYNRLIEKNSF